MSQNILILGATSSIARAIAAEFAAKDYNLYLASRDQAELAKISTDLMIRFPVTVQFGKFDAVDFASHATFLQDVIQKMHSLSGAVLAFGYLGDDNKTRQFSNDHQIINANFTGAVSILNYCADYFVAQKNGFILALSSVAGDRGRQSNYAYGAAKSALTTYLQGLRNSLFSSNVRVITIKLGLVDTAMTFARPGLFLLAKPEKVAQQILHKLKTSADISYIPWFWRYIMFFVKCIPEKIFKRLKL